MRNSQYDAARSGIISRVIRRFLPRPQGDEQVMIVLGARMIGRYPSNSLRYRLETAYEYASAHPELLLITTGGQGKNEILPEGEGMKQYLVARGISGSRILTESKSTSTQENFVFTRRLMKKRGFDENIPLIIVTNDYHCYRAYQYAKMAGFKQIRVLPTGTPSASVPENYFRETLSMLKLIGIKLFR